MSRLDNFYFANRLRWLHTSLQVFLGIVLTFGLLYLSATYFKRWDLSGHHRYALSDETLACLEGLQVPLTIYVTFSKYDRSEELQRVQNDLHALLREYTFAVKPLQKPLLTVVYLDPYLQRQSIDHLEKSLGMPCDNSVILKSDTRHEVLMAGDFYKIEAGKIVGFVGEQALTSALMRLLQVKAPKGYFIVGHGELSLDAVNPFYGASQAHLFAKSRGLSLGSLDLLAEPIPQDADFIVIAGPRRPFLPEEVAFIKAYLRERNGRVMLFLSPLCRSGLEDVCQSYGILADGALVVDKAANAHLSNGDLMIRRLAEHRITQGLIDYRLALVTSGAVAVRPIMVFENSTFLKVTPLMISSDNSWAKPYGVLGDVDTFEPTKGDFYGPISLGCVSEAKDHPLFKMGIHWGSLVVLGMSDWLSNHQFSNLGNAHFFWQLCDWGINRAPLLSVPPRLFNEYQLTLSQSDVMQLLFYFSLPGLCFLVFGLTLYFFTRPSQKKTAA